MKLLFSRTIMAATSAAEFAAFAMLTAFVTSAPALAQSFTDPTVQIVNPNGVKIGKSVYIAPFAKLHAPKGDDNKQIVIGDESDVQDSALIDATTGTVTLGSKAIMAHGSVIKGSAKLGVGGTCHGGGSACPSFIGFNAVVDGAIVERDAMVLHLARVAPGVRIPSGRKVLSGFNVATQAQVAAKTAPVTEVDREFMNGVIEVNVALAHGYASLAATNPAFVRGINFDPGFTSFNPTRELPTLGTDGPTSDPNFRNRIIGDVHTCLRYRDEQLSLAALQLAYKVRAVLGGEMRSEWSPFMAVGQPLKARASSP